MRFKFLLILFLLASILFLTPQAFAHVVVKPAEVGVATYQTFSVSVPNEKDVNVTELRLQIPKGVESVSPTVKQGWSIDVVKKGDVTVEIKWSGGAIPAGQRDDFTFSAKTPGKETTLDWKAYQTYEDGTTVSWNQDPSKEHIDEEERETGPYSTTKIINDLEPTPAPQSQSSGKDVFIWAALALSIVAITMSLTRKK